MKIPIAVFLEFNLQIKFLRIKLFLLLFKILILLFCCGSAHESQFWNDLFDQICKKDYSVVVLLICFSVVVLLAIVLLNAKTFRKQF